MKKNNRQNILRISEVDKTLIKFCSFNFLSLDQTEHPNFKANAKYSVSFGSGQTSEALEIKDLNSEKGMNSILEEINDKITSKSILDNLDLSRISFPWFLISSNKYSGAYNFNLSEKNSSQVLPKVATNADIITFASTINSINYSPDSFVNLSCKDLLIFLPNSKASLSVNFDLEEINLSNFNCDSFPLIATLATADQLISTNSFISFFNSSGTDNVITDIFNLQICNLFNISNVFNIFKTFGASQ